LPPEHETESRYGAPVATGRYVWVANPTSGRVAYIDAVTLAIHLVDAGDGPTYLAAVPDPAGEDTAIVLNVRSHDATLLHANKAGDVKATSYPAPSSGNAWAIAPSGKFAIAWSDARRVDKPDPLEGFQDLTVIDLTKGASGSHALTVGYRPVAIGFDSSSKHAYAVTQDGVSVIDLEAGPAVTKNVAIADSAADPTPTLDVSITPDGAFALARRDGLKGVRVVSLADGTKVDLPLPDVPTDLDLLPDGSLAVAVIRATNQIALLPLPLDPATVKLIDATSLVGSTSLAPSGATAFFYTNATPNPVLTVIDTTAATPFADAVLLRAPIEGVFPSPTGAHALALHGKLDAEGSHYAAAVSLAPIAAKLPPKIVGLDAPPIAIAVTDAHAVVACGDDATGVYEVALADLPSLAVQIQKLASLPIAAGVVPGADRAYVAQKHPDGRITFVDLATGKARTLTGFELATGVVDGPGSK
jgi:hypothetical protein